MADVQGMGSFEYNFRLMEPDDREARLPLWAREKLDLARRTARECHEVALALIEKTDPSGSRVVVDGYKDHPVGLGNPSILFKMPDERDGTTFKDDRWITVRASGRHGGLEVMGTSSVIIRPGSSNWIQLDLE